MSKANLNRDESNIVKRHPYKRIRVIPVYFNDAEYELVKAKAEKMYLKVGSFIRLLALRGRL